MDYEQAFYWFERAADQNDGESQYRLAQSYENGWGIEVNMDMARQYYTKAVENGYDDAE